MPRFVVLRHAFSDDSPRASHWDLMLEDELDLITWALEALPGSSAVKVNATRLPAHRLAYLTYEGPVSGDRGHVQRCDAGEYEWLTREADLICVQLQGQLLRGHATLERNVDGEHAWTLDWESL
jgi:hypothetical protein